MTISNSNKSKGNRVERFFRDELKEFFPEAGRNLNQPRGGGVDLIKTDPFNIEIKGGKSYTYKGIRDMLDQVQSASGKTGKYDIVLVNPHYEDPYVIIPFDMFKQILRKFLGSDSGEKAHRIGEENENKW